jgi:RNA polymerase sigma factor (sigma-70 family)
MISRTNVMSDTDIIASIKSSNDKINNKALKSLYLLYFDIIKSYILQNNGTEDDAKDIFQESLIIFYKKIKSGDLQLNCKIKTYIYSICKNKWLDKLRGAKNHTRILQKEFGNNNNYELFNDPLEGEEKMKTIEKLLNSISKDCKKVLHYFYYERLNMNDIAQKMGYKGEQSAKNKKLKCLKYIRQHMNKHPEYIISLK